MEERTTAMVQMCYPLWYRWNGREAYLPWFSDNRDGVLLTEDGRVPVFDTIDTLRPWLMSHGFDTSPEEPLLHDMDALDAWLRQPSREGILPDVFLNAWNLFIDLQASIEQRDVLREDKEQDALLYQKLFWSNNLPSLMPPGKHYEPIWTDAEVLRLHTILRRGLQYFAEKVTLVEAT